MDAQQRISPDSSTHGTVKAKKRKSKHHSHKSGKKKRKTSSLEKSPPVRLIKDFVGVPECELPLHLRNLELDIKPLQDHLHDKAELHRQLFKIINKKTFKGLLGPALSKYDAKEIRNWCLEELQAMSQKRIRCAIEDTEMTSSSSSSEDETLAPEGLTVNGRQETGHLVVPECHAGNKANVSADQSTEKAGLSILDELSISPGKEEIDELLNGDKCPSEVEMFSESLPNTEKSCDHEETERTLEFLEMELRARALQSLLKRKE